jgi:hypothetical protein
MQVDRLPRETGTWCHLGTCSVASVAALAPATARPADVAPGGAPILGR